MFVGYSERVKIYKFINVTTNKVVVSRDVIIDEKASFFSSKPYYTEEGVGSFNTKNQVKLQGTTMQEEKHTTAGDVHEANGDDGSNNALEIVVQTDDKPKWLCSLLEGVRPEELPQPRVEGRSKRKCTKQVEHVHYALISNVLTCFEPQTYDEAKVKDEWETAMTAKYDALVKNKTSKLVDLPPSKKPICCKWMYKVMCNADGTLDKYKARLVAIKMVTIKLAIALATQFGWKLFQIDIKSTFLNDNFEETYMD